MLAMRNFTVGVFVMLAIFSGNLAYGQQQTTAAIDAEKAKDIEFLLQITGSEKIATQMLNAVIPQISQKIQTKSVGKKAKAEKIISDTLRAEFKTSMPEFMQAVTVLYDKAFTGQEIKDIIAFYQTPTGRKSIAIMPQLIQGSMMVGQKWGLSVTYRSLVKIKQRLEKEGIAM